MFVLFDFDGTLADTFNLFRDAFDEAAEQLHTTPYRRQDDAFIRTLEATDVLRFHDVPQEKFPAFAQLLRDGMDARREQAALFSGVKDALEQLHSDGHRLGIVSSNARRLVEHILSPLMALFEASVTDVGLKTKDEALREASGSAIGISSTCYIGDEIRDLRAARSAVVTFIGVTWGYNTGDALQTNGCDVLVRNPRDINAVVQSLI